MTGLRIVFIPSSFMAIMRPRPCSRIRHIGSVNRLIVTRRDIVALSSGVIVGPFRYGHAGSFQLSTEIGRSLC